MILVRFVNFRFHERLLLPESGRESVSVSVSGHSEQGTKGYDVVCSAVSALAHTLVCSIARIGGLEQSCEEGNGLLKTEIAVDGLDEGKKKSCPCW